MTTTTMGPPTETTETTETTAPTPRRPYQKPASSRMPDKAMKLWETDDCHACGTLHVLHSKRPAAAVWRCRECDAWNGGGYAYSGMGQTPDVEANNRPRWTGRDSVEIRVVD